MFFLCRPSHKSIFFLLCITAAHNKPHQLSVEPDKPALREKKFVFTSTAAIIAAISAAVTVSTTAAIIVSDQVRAKQDRDAAIELVEREFEIAKKLLEAELATLALNEEDPEKMERIQEQLETLKADKEEKVKKIDEETNKKIDDLNKKEALEEEKKALEENESEEKAIKDKTEKVQTTLETKKPNELTEEEKIEVKELMKLLRTQFKKAMKQLKAKEEKLHDEKAKAKIEEVEKTISKWLDEIDMELANGIDKDDQELLEKAAPELTDAVKNIDSILVKNLEVEVPGLKDASTQKARAKLLDAKLPAQKEKILKKLQEIDPKEEGEEEEEVKKKVPKDEGKKKVSSQDWYEGDERWWVVFGLCFLAFFICIGGVVWLSIVLRRRAPPHAAPSQGAGNV